MSAQQSETLTWQAPLLVFWGGGPKTHAGKKLFGRSDVRGRQQAGSTKAGGGTGKARPFLQLTGSQRHLGLPRKDSGAFLMSESEPGAQRRPAHVDFCLSQVFKGKNTEFI